MRMRKIGIVCMVCGAKGTHEMGGPVRLRAKIHKPCGGRARPMWWIRRYPAKALGEATGEGARATVEALLSAARQREELARAGDRSTAPLGIPSV